MEPFDNKTFSVFLFVMRVWFATILLNHAILQAGSDTIYLLFNFIAGNKVTTVPTQSIVYLTRAIELLCGLLLLIGIFVRYSSIILIAIMLIAIVTSMTHLIDFGGENAALTRIFFCFSAILIVFGAGKWSTDQWIGSKKAT